MKHKIFISYRHVDSATMTNRIYQHLSNIFPKEDIFRDIESIPLGVDFEGHIHKVVAACDILLVVMGKKWLTACDENGNTRLDNLNDLVALEVITGMRRNIPIIPLLVDDISMPKKEQLPQRLSKLVMYNGTRIGDVSFDKDMERLVQSIRSIEVNKHKLLPEEYGLTFLQEKTYSCNGSSFSIKEYQHDKTTLLFSYVPPGTFAMGSNDADANDWEKPQHDVTLPGFLISKYPVTQKIWQKIMGSNPSSHVKEQNPVENVSWYDCKTFCNKTGLSLPSESMWEYACRSGSTSAYYWGDHIDDDYCWYNNNAQNTSHPVGEKKPNAFGLYDMSGNICEWCLDNEHDNYYGAPNDGSAWEGSSDYRVYRGGCFSFNKEECRSISRRGNDPNMKGVILGFRPVIHLR